MRRAFAAAALLAAALLLCIISLTATIQVTESVNETARAALKASTDRDTDRAKELTGQLKEEWDQAEAVLGAFIRHEELELIGNAISSLPGLLEDDNLLDYQKECRTALHWLEHVRETELPAFPNIL